VRNPVYSIVGLKTGVEAIVGRREEQAQIDTASHSE
jgi:hypothetical protein